MSEFAIEEVTWTAAREHLRRIREVVFVAEQSVPLSLELDEADPVCIHLLARDTNRRPIATARMKPDGHIGRMAVLRPWRGRGVGSALLSRLLAIARERGMARVYLHAQVQALPFYERHGFIAQGETFLDAGIVHRTMVYELE